MKNTTKQFNTHFNFAILAIITVGFLLWHSIAIFNLEQELQSLQSNTAISKKASIQKDDTQGTETENTDTEILYNEDGSIDTSNWKTYTNEEYGFSVKYPEGWDSNEVARENGCSENTQLIKGEDPCARIYYFSRSGQESLAVASKLFFEYPPKYGGRWEVPMKDIRINSLENFCKQKNKIYEDSYREIDGLECLVFKTHNNIYAVKDTHIIPFTEDKMMVSYFIKIPNSIYSVIGLTPGESMEANKKNGKVIEKMIQTLQLKN